MEGLGSNFTKKQASYWEVITRTWGSSPVLQPPTTYCKGCSVPAYASLCNWALEETRDMARKESGFTAELCFWPLGSKLNGEAWRECVSQQSIEPELPGFPCLGKLFWPQRLMVSGLANLWAPIFDSRGMPVGRQQFVNMAPEWWWLTILVFIWVLVPIKITVDSQSWASSWQ